MKCSSLILFIGGIAWLLESYAFLEVATLAQAVLTSPPRRGTTGTSKNRRDVYYTDYSFKIGETSYTGHGSLQSRPGSNDITVFYDRTNPSSNRPQLPETWEGWFLTLFGAVMSLGYFQPWKWLYVRKGALRRTKTRGRMRTRGTSGAADPDDGEGFVYGEWLESKGYSDDTIDEAKRHRSQKSPQTEPQAQGDGPAESARPKPESQPQNQRNDSKSARTPPPRRPVDPEPKSEQRRKAAETADGREGPYQQQRATNENEKTTEQGQRSQNGPVKDEAFFRSVLGIGPDASPTEIKRRYRELVAQYHPDKVAHLGPKLQELAAREMQAINGAYDFFRKKHKIV